MADEVQPASRPEIDQAASAPSGERGQRLAALGGVLGALAASSCCVLPLLLAALGISGAWMSGLRALASYQPYFIALAVAAIGYGFYQSYWTRREACTVRAPTKLARSGLWLATAIVAVAISFPYWFPFAEPFLP